MAKIASDLASALAARIGGDVLTPDDAAYEVARKVHNGMIDKRPALIAMCRNASDASAAVALGRDEGLEISIKGGGHNVAGKAVTDGGLMIDLTSMKNVDVDPAARTATAGGGVLWSEYNDATAQHGLASTGGVISTTGVAGLTLGGGIGALMGTQGLAIDTLASAEVVLANGDVVTASDATDPDLFWAIRGGGGNFGVVTDFTFNVQPLETVLGGLAAHMLDAAPDVFRFVRDAAEGFPDELSVNVALTHTPDGSGTKICGVAACHSGDDAQAESDLAPIRGFGPPVLDLIDRMPYPVINTLLDDAFQKGSLNYWKSAYFKDLSDDAVAIMVDRFAQSPTIMCGMLVENIHGAVTRVAPTATAFPHRSPGYNLVILGQWTDPSETDDCVAWVRETFDALGPYMADEVYVNYLGAEEADRVRTAYGPNYERLVELKRRYDPENLFRLNQNIDPSG